MGDRRAGNANGGQNALLALVLTAVGWGGVHEASALVNTLPECIDTTYTGPLCSAGAFHTCAASGMLIEGSDREFTRKVVCWGWQEFGQSEAPAPEAIEAPTLMAAGARHSCAADINGVVSCWGSNQYAQTEVAKPMKTVGQAINADQGITLETVSSTQGCTYCNRGSYISDVNSREYGACEDKGMLDYNLEMSSCKRECILEGVEGVFQSYIRANKSTDAQEYPTFRFDGRFMCGAHKLAAGGQHTCVIYGDPACSNCNMGFMKCYGSNIYGQSMVPWCRNHSDVPERVANERGDQLICRQDGRYPLLWIQVSTGLFHTCAVDSFGFKPSILNPKP